MDCIEEGDVKRLLQVYTSRWREREMALFVYEEMGDRYKTEVFVHLFYGVIRGCF